jgi:cell division cycle 2-like protein
VLIYLGPSTTKRVNEKELDQGDTKRVKISSAPMSRFDRQKCCGHGSFGKVWSAKEIATGNIVALKQIKISGSEGFPRTAIREIGIMKKHFHPNILSLSEVVWADFGDVYLVMEYFDFDLRKLLEKHSIKFSIPEVKYLFQQLTTGMCYMHKNLIMHRDLKTENILINNNGHLKICDFGLSRSYTPGQLKYYTPVVVTLWYRSPELLLGPCAYSWEIDQWSVGCIFGELLRSCVLFAGANEVDQVEKIFSILGTPNENTWKNFRELPGTQNQSYRNYPPRLNQIFTSEVVSSIGYELLSGLLTYQPDRRMTAFDAMSHDYFIESPGAVNYIDILSKI